MYCFMFIYVEAHLPPFYELLLALVAFYVLCNYLEKFSRTFTACARSFLQIIDEDIE